MSLLEIKDVSISFGGIKALQNVTTSVGQQQIYAVIGPNGAGKSTLFNCISGLRTADSGTILYKGLDITSREPYEVARLGVARTFQNLRLFKNLTAIENVLIGSSAKARSSIVSSLLRTTGFVHERKQRILRALELLEFVGIAEDAFKIAHSLPYGKQRRLEIARALALEPDLLLLDEPAAGMNYGEIQELLALFRAIQKQGKTIILVEHDMRLVMTVSERIAVLDYGRKIAEGTPAEVRVDKAVLDAYLGEEEESTDA